MNNNSFFKNFLFILLFFGTITAVQATDLAGKKDVLEPEIILADINNYRFLHHLPPLTLNKQISEQAELHSSEMAKNKVPFGHDGFKERMQSIFTNMHSAEAFAENVAFTGGDPKSVVNLWLNSAGHRKNIEGDYNLTGIGIAHDENNRVYVTQIFIRTNETLADKTYAAPYRRDIE